MGTFTAAGNPEIERVIGSHMERIVEAVCEGMEPDAILLRGSFGKGEGDVLLEHERLKFLSDYEINVATYSFRHRGYLNAVANRLSVELGVETSIVWMRPDYFYKLRVGPFIAGPVPITISLYETRHGSHLLYGKDLLQSAPEIDPSCITMESGLQLLLNRMAEALHYLPEPDGTATDEWQSVFWLNKLILACIESLLLCWGQYHYSYRERGLRFSRLASGQLGFLGMEGEVLYQLGQRATQFKMQPRRELYPQSLQELTQRVVSICEHVFAYLASREWGLTMDDPYTAYPRQYQRKRIDRLAPFSYERALHKLLDTYKYLRTRRLPYNLLSPNTAGEIIYSIVPLLFAGWRQSRDTLSLTVPAVRYEMRKVSRLPPAQAESRAEWRQLCQQMIPLWKNFCT